MVDEKRVDALGNEIPDNNMVGISNPNIILASYNQADASNQVSEKPDQTVARLTADAIEKRDKIVALGGKLDGLPEISGLSAADLQNVVDVYERKRAEVADKAAMEFQKNAMGAAFVAGAAGLAGVGVASPEIAEAIIEKNKLPINTQFDKLLDGLGAGDRSALATISGGQSVNEVSALDKSLPARTAELALVNNERSAGGRERSMA